MSRIIRVYLSYCNKCNNQTLHKVEKQGNRKYVYCALHPEDKKEI